MSYLASSPITLSGIPLQIKDGGFSVGAITQVDEARPWVSRSKLAAARDDNDTLGFDMVSIIGARTRISYVETDHTVPPNNVVAINDLYKKVMRRNISLSGSTMDAADYSSFYASYVLAQDYWAQRTQLLAQIGDEDIPFSTLTALVVSLDALVKPVLAFVSPLVSGDVTFSEGDGCSFSAYIENIVTDFSFELVFDAALPAVA